MFLIKYGGSLTLILTTRSFPTTNCTVFVEQSIIKLKSTKYI